MSITIGRMRLLDFMRQADDPRLINLAAGIPAPEHLPVGELHAAVERVLASGGPRVFAYQAPEGDWGLRTCWTRRLVQRGCEKVEEDRPLICTGCTQALHLALSCSVREGDTVLCEGPSYYGMLEILVALQVRVVQMPVNTLQGWEPEELARWLAEYRPRLVVICSSLSNPSGATVPLSRRFALVEVCRQAGVGIIEDDIYGEWVEPQALPPLRAFDDGSTVTYVSSVSKTVAPGLRGGVVVARDDLRERIAERKCREDLHGATFAEAVLREFLSAGALERTVQRIRPVYARRRNLLGDAVRRFFPEGTQVFVPGGGYMIWVTLPEPVDMNEVKRRALARGVAFAPGDVFFAGQRPSRHLRLNAAKAAEEDLVVAVQVIGECVQSAQPARMSSG